MITRADDRSQALTPNSVGGWVRDEASDPKFPFRLRIYTRKRAEPVLSFFVQDRWPGSNQHIFCLLEARIADDVTIGAEVERIPVVALQRYGRRLSVVLDRPRQKRCDFQIVEKTYKNPDAEGPATYEQIFWFTQTAMRQRRPRGARLHTARPEVDARVRIASDERYPWHLGPFESERGRLPAGDYALVVDGAVAAVVERKTFDGLLAEFGRMDVLRQRLLELSSYEHHAIVIEAPYEDFLNPAKVRHWPAAFCARAIADLCGRYPRLRIVFCANRKIAETWTRNYFAAVSATIEAVSVEDESASQNDDNVGATGAFQADDPRQPRAT